MAQHTARPPLLEALARWFGARRNDAGPATDLRGGARAARAARLARERGDATPTRDPFAASRAGLRPAQESADPAAPNRARMRGGLRSVMHRRPGR